MTLQQKKLIDATAPLLLAIGLLYYLYSQKKPWQWLAIGGIAAYLVAYAVVTQITKTVVSNSPADIQVGAGCDNYDPTALMNGIYNDISCFFCFRDRTLYDTLLGLQDCQFRAAYNYWNDNFYGKAGNQSLPIAIQSQGNALDALFGQQQANLKIRFDQLGLQ